MDPAYVQNLHNLLEQATYADTNVVKAATVAVKRDYYLNPQTIPALFDIIATLAESWGKRGVRQLAAVELRKRIGADEHRLWTALPQDIRITIKQKSLEISLSESQRPVRNSIARVISAIANIELPLNTWLELLRFLDESCNSATAAHREVGIFVLHAVLESIVGQSQYAAQISSFMELFARLLLDPESLDVRVTTIRSLGVVADYIGERDKDDIRRFAALLPGIITVLGQCITNDDEPSSRHIFGWSTDKNISSELRIMALNSLDWLVKYKRSKVQSLNLAPQIIQSLILAVAEPEDDLDGESVYSAALRVVDELALKLPPTQVFPSVLATAQQCIQNSDPQIRRAGLLILGVSVEGCSDHMQSRMELIWPILEAEPAATAACSVCEYLGDECVERHAVLVPGLLALMGDDATQKDATTALGSLIESLEEVIGDYLPILMDRFVSLLDSASVKVKTLATACIGSTASAAHQNFLPYFQPIMAKFETALSLSDEGDEGDLRGITIDSIGTLAEAVGREAFAPYFHPMMVKSFELLQTTQTPRIHECAYILWGILAGVYTDDFQQYLPRCIPPLLESCQKADIEGETTGQSEVDALAVDDTDTGDLDEEGVNIEVNSAITSQKEIAVDTLGTLFAHTTTAFMPFVERSTLVLIDMLEHYYEGIRKAAVSSLFEFVQTMYKLSNQGTWEPGFPPAVYLHGAVSDIVQHSLAALIHMYSTEDDKDVVTTLFNNLAETMNLIGPAYLSGSSIPRPNLMDDSPVPTEPVPHVESICQMVEQILDKKSLCQNDPDEEPTGGSDEEEQSELDSLLIQCAGDVVSALAAILGKDFSGLFPRFFLRLARYYKKKLSLMDRSSAIGVLAEILQAMKTSVTPFTDDVLQIIGRALADPDAEVVNNACYAVGLVVEYSEVDLSGQYLLLLAQLHGLFTISADASDAQLNARDNAAGAVARMIIRNSSAIPLDQVLPVLLDIMPLESDPVENKTVFRALLLLFHTNPAPLMAHIDQVLSLMARVLDPSADDVIGDEVRAGLIEVVKSLYQQYPGKISATGLTPFAQ
ncbi:ARM repeat-containing protein [Auriculariales sp. MPI-PUGE-AT-0066]|nr:ARM repeat-containing protein [Auriculariales sp. MPI-PUGE-AT-0066]